jgi:DNA invertase Pin-like site-specific DNA recombinase
MTEPKRVALYIRVSTDEQSERGLSLDTQIHTLQQAALARGFTGPFCLFCDAGISGGTVAKRPAMSLLLEEVQAKQVDVLIATKLDRLWRNTRDALNALESLKKAGVAFIILDMHLDATTPFGEAMFTMLATFARLEATQAGERVQAVNRRIVAQGRHVGGHTPPLGYKRDPVTKQLSIDPETAPLIRLIFELYLSDQTSGAYQIARQFNDQGQLSPTGRLWDQLNILRILRNPVYVGEVVYGNNGPKHKRWLSDEGRIRATGTHEALIDRATWEAVQSKMRRRRTAGRDTSPKRLLSGLLYCEDCQARMYSSWGGSPSQALFECGSMKKGGRQACPTGKRIFSRVLDELVIAAIARNLTAARAKGWAQRKAAKPAQVKRQIRERDWLQGKLDRLQEVYIDGGLDPEVYRNRRAALLSELAALEQPAAPFPVLPDASSLEEFEAVVSSEKVPAGEKRSLVSALVDRIIVGPENLTVHYRDFGLLGWRTEEQIVRPKPWEFLGRKKRGKGKPKQ